MKWSEPYAHHVLIFLLVNNVYMCRQTQYVPQTQCLFRRTNYIQICFFLFFCKNVMWWYHGTVMVLDGIWHNWTELLLSYVLWYLYGNTVMQYSELKFLKAYN